MLGTKVRRWIPAITAPVLVAALALAPTAAVAEIDLPEKSAAELMLFMNSEPVPFSGTIVKKANLGLPEYLRMPEVDEATLERMREQMPEGMEDFMLQATSSNQVAQLLEFAAGEHTLRVYYGGERQLRVQVLDRMSQRDLILNENNIWVYNDRQRKAWHAEIDPAFEADARDYAAAELLKAAEGLPAELATPEAAIEALLGKLDEDASVTVGTARLVAGREAYEIVVTPDQTDSTVASVSIAIDGEFGMPLAASVFARGEVEPVFEIAFTSISFAAPSSAIFDFTPGADVTVEKVEIPSIDELRAELESTDWVAELTDEQRAQLEEFKTKAESLSSAEVEQMKQQLEQLLAERTVIYQNGWASVVEVRADVDVSMLDLEYFDSLVTQVAEGRVISTSLLSVLITNDGRILMGAVNAEKLQALAN